MPSPTPSQFNNILLSELLEFLINIDFQSGAILFPREQETFVVAMNRRGSVNG
jgi:hypothetical protein